MGKCYRFTLMLYLSGSMGRDRKLWKVLRTLLTNGTGGYKLNSRGITECIICKNLDQVKETERLEHQSGSCLRVDMALTIVEMAAGERGENRDSPGLIKAGHLGKC